MKKNVLKGRRGFTLLEVLVVLVVAAIIFGVSVMLMGQGSQLAAVNNAYSMAQRAALAAVEFLPKEISVAREVEIISRDYDAAGNLLHNIQDGISDDWRYIKLDADTKTVVHIQELDGGNLKLEPLPGSDLITALRFDAGGNKSNGEIRKLLHINLTARSTPDGGTARDYDRTVSLDRSILVHAPLGVTGEGGIPISEDNWLKSGNGGSILRYRIEYDDTQPTIDLFCSKGTTGTFDTIPDTWKAIENPNTTTLINAKLFLPKRLKQDTVVFSWIAVDEAALLNNLGQKADSASLLTYLAGDGTAANPGRMSNADWGKIRSRLAADDISDIEDAGNSDYRASWISFVKEPSFEDDPLNLTSSDVLPQNKGIRLLKMTSGKLSSGSNNEYELNTPFNLGEIVNIMMSNGNDYYHGAYMIVMAHYKDGANWRDWPVYVRMGDEESDSIFREIVNALATVPLGDAGKVGNVFVNADANSAKLEAADTSANNGNGMFRVSGRGTNSANAPKVILELVPENFRHMVPKDNGSPVMYGVTNYAVYLDATTGADGGYGVYLNGTEVDASGTRENKQYYTTSGYVFQFDPGARGLIMRYQYYTSAGAYQELGDTTFGVIPMYFYDASRRTTNDTYAAPREISFFDKNGVISKDNLNLNTGEAANASIYYRMPFKPVSGYYFQNIERFPRLRDTGERYRSDQTYNWGFYGASGSSVQWMSTYTPKLMQSWHNYGHTISTVPQTLASSITANREYIDTYNDDNLLDKTDVRHGYRWDWGWGFDTAAQGMWRRRQILKLTVLEITKDITQSDIGYDTIGGVNHYWQEPIYPAETRNNSPVVHKAGDLFVRLEMIQLRKNPKPKNGTYANPDPNNSRNYVYSKPIWFGKIKGDAWRGDDPSPLKKMGDRTAHIVSPIEPRAGDAQSFRRRGMRVRSWKDAFYGQDFSITRGTDTDPNTGAVSYRRGAGGATSGIPFTGAGNWPPDYPRLGYVGTDNAIWTPPIAINLNAAPDSDGTATWTGTNPTLRGIAQPDTVDAVGAVVVDVSNTNNDTTAFGQYSYGSGEFIMRERKGTGTSGDPYRFAHNDFYTDRIYGRLSLLRPFADRAKPLYGLYAMRGWDYGYNDNTGVLWDGDSLTTANNNNSAKRFLMVVRGQRMPYNLHAFTAPDTDDTTIETGYYNRENGRTGDYTPDRVRTLAFRFWSSDNTQPTLYYDDWIGEGFNPWEVREILGLNRTTYPVFIRDGDASNSEKDSENSSRNKNDAYNQTDFNNWMAIRKFYIQGNGDASGTGETDDRDSTSGLTALQKKKADYWPDYGFYVRPPAKAGN
ncbi:hypothetical protein AGMMS50276_12240 [Synergistales bacterium]|nr:hypothetical protein AGMMS50276_12240 [Synergistales bacterium]